MLVIVKTPLQIMCAVEYAHSINFPLNDIKFIYLRKYSFADNQIYNTFKFYSITNFEQINIYQANTIKLFNKNYILKKQVLKTPFVLKKKLLNPIKIKKIYKQIVSLKSDEILVIGDPNSKESINFIEFFQSKNIVFLDDGLSSLVLNSSIKNHKKIKSFSLIRDESNTFLFTKSKLKQNFIGDSDNIVFIGQPLIEAKIITLNELNSLIKEVALRFKNQTIYYFPHRWEQNTSNYSFPKNIKILDNNNPLPIELLLNSKNLLPKIVLSFYSTALITLKLIYLDQTSFSAVSTEKLLSIDKVNNAYKYLKDYGISTIEL